MSDKEYQIKIVNNLATEILNKTTKNVDIKDDEYGIDPITIIICISIIVNVIRVIQECKKKSQLMKMREKKEYLTAEIKSLSFNDTFFTRLKARKVIKQKLTKDQYKKYGESMLTAIIETGKYIKDDQVEALLEYENV